ncbi:metallophosphoesterase [Hellea sp.]|nr:metallophosphoesterase [Hellea sp.]
MQLSDIHFGTEDKDALAAARIYANSLSPDLVLICGDITQDGKVEEFEAARDWISGFDSPKLITPGNHDTPVFGIIQRIFNPFGRYDKYIKPLSLTEYTDKNIAIQAYNTARGIQAKFDWSLGVVDLEQLNQKIQSLKNNPPETLKMIAVHHPLIYPDVSPLQVTTKNGEAAVKMLSDANIDAVLSGHVHAPFLIERDPGRTSLLSIGSGTLSTRMRGKPASFNHIEIDDTHLSVTAIDWIDDNYVRAKSWTKRRDALDA